MFASLAYANDTAFGGSGASPMPIEKTEIKMVDEHITITGHEIDKENMQGKWNVSCDFTFQNMTDKPITLDMGFPFPVYEKEENITAPAGMQPRQGAPLVYHFAVTVDGKDVPATKQNIASNPEKGLHYKHAYIWKMHFLPHQIVKVHHDYAIGVTFNVMGYSLVNYVLLTGGLWQGGTIGDAKIEIIPNTPTHLCSELDDTAAEYLQPKPQGMKIAGNGQDRKYIWNLKNLKPKEDVDVCLQTGKSYVRYSLIYPLLNNLGDKQIDLKKMNKQELKILRNSIYAQYGRRFESPDLQEYFNKQWWYEPSKDYSENMLTSEDRQAIALIKKAEAQS